jgi:nucleoside-diphosphate-sugar epimerase
MVKRRVGLGCDQISGEEADMSERVVVFGYGPVGRATTELLARQGRQVRVAQRSQPKDLPPGVAFQPCDVLDAKAVMAAALGASHIVIAVGFAYSGKVWRKDWPKAMANFLYAAEVTQARVVFFDNLYMYGAQDAPLREDMALTGKGAKPAARAAVTRMWQEAAAAGRVTIAALRAPDFYGPGVTLSHIGDSGFGRLAAGKSAMLLAPPDTPHDFAYVPDLARNIVTLLDAPADVYGQVWHAPCAPTRTPRQILAAGAKALDAPLKVTALPLWVLPVMGLFTPFMKELSEMRFQWDRPYRVDWSKWAARFGDAVTPFDKGARETALSFQAEAKVVQGDALAAA